MPSSPINNRKDVLLLLLYSPGIEDEQNEPIVGRTRLVKMLFLFRQEALPLFKKGTSISEENFYEFFAWNFGPFSTEVYDDLNFFLIQGFVEAQGSGDEPLSESAQEWDQYISDSGVNGLSENVEVYEDESFRLSPKGVAWVEKHLVPTLANNQRTLLKEFKRKLQTPLRGILRYVYTTYPDFTAKSQIRDEVLGSR